MVAERFNSLNDKRVVFPKGKQHNFLFLAKNQLRLSWTDLAKKLGVLSRTFNDWKREKYSLPLKVARRISRMSKISIPEEVKSKSSYWWVRKAAKIGGQIVYEKYGSVGGDSDYRVKKWREWWTRTGQFSQPKAFRSREIVLPKKGVDLAEFMGILMGDGGITKRQVTVTLHFRDDKPYSIFVSNLAKRLFRLQPRTYIKKSDSVVNIVISRTRLVEFCISLGLKVGNKVRQQIDIPRWIKTNKNFAIACVRGLMDTDGCIFNECHQVKRKKYCYLRLSFVSSSEPLRISVYTILKNSGFSPKMRNHRSVQLENRAEILKYFKIVGTHNPKHNARLKSFLEGSDNWSFHRS